MTTSADQTGSEAASPAWDEGVLREIAQRVLWLSAAIVDAANAGRANLSGVKVGGHQASSASMVDIMTALWFAELTPLDRVSVKPHASPVMHAVNYLLGDLDQSYLPTLRAKGGLQSYPSRLKDPDTVLDGHPHTLASLAGVRGDHIRCLGVTEFGQSSGLEDAYRIHHIDTGSIVDAALTLVRR